MKRKNINTLKNIVLTFFVIISFCLPFIASGYTNDFYIEKSAYNITQVIQNNTSKKKYLTIATHKKTSSASIPDPAIEFYNLYGVFRQNKATFGCVIDYEREASIKINNVSDELCFYYYGPMGTINYYGHYKHYIYPLELMFQDNKSSYKVCSYVASISQTHADKILENNGVQKKDGDKYLSSDYYSLINTKVKFNIKGKDYDFAISNIYYEQNYYYEALNESIGDFVMVSYYLPENLRQKQTNLYFMNTSEFENQYFMNYLNSNYNRNLIDLKVNKYNLVNPINENDLLNFYYGNESNNPVVIVLFILSGLLLIGCLIFSFFLCNNFKWYNHLVILASGLIPYIIFSFVNNVSLFGYTGRKFYLITLIIFIIAYVIIDWIYLNHRRKRIESHENIDI